MIVKISGLSSDIVMEIGRSSIQFKRCAMGTAFLQKIMESPRGSSAIIMEIGRSSIQCKRCAMGTAFLPKIMESQRGSSAIIMDIGRRFNLKGVPWARPFYPRSWRA